MIVEADALESDMSRFHQIHDYNDISFPKLARLAEWIWTYRGAVYHAFTREKTKQTSTRVSNSFDLATDPEGQAVGYRGKQAPNIQPISALAAQVGGSFRLVKPDPAA